MREEQVKDKIISIQRVRFWDIAKGMTIILMILGHTLGVPDRLHALIFSFHMPIFFLINAYFIKDYNVKTALKKSAKSLLVPYLAVCAIAAVVDMFINLDNPLKALGIRINAIILGLSFEGILFPEEYESVWLMWFVCCLFVARIVYVGIRQMTRKLPEAVAVMIIAVLVGIGAILGYKGYFLPWSLDVALVALIFMLIGDWLRKYDFLRKAWFLWLSIPMAILWIGLTYYGYWIEMAMRSYKGGPLCIATAICGSIVVILIAKLFEKIELLAKAFSWCGKNSMVILAVHCLEMMYINWSNNFVIADVSETYMWMIRFVLRLLVILVISALYTYIKKLIANLFEKK